MDPDKIYSDYTFWRHEGLNPIVTAESYATLLLEERLGELNDEQKKWVRIILRNSKEARRSWDDFGAYLQARYHLQKNADRPQFLADAIRHALTSNLQRYKYLARPEIVEIEIPASMQMTRINPEFESVFFYLLAPAFKLMETNETAHAITPKITASLKNAGTVTLQMHSAVRHFHIPENRQTDFPYPNIDINLAYFILKQKGVLLNMEVVSGEREAMTMIDFNFDLPIWQENAV